MLVGDAKDHLPAAFIGDGGAVTHKFFEVEVVLRLLELQVFVLS